MDSIFTLKTANNLNVKNLLSRGLMLLLFGLVCMFISSPLVAQQYVISNSGLDVGNPGGLRTVSDATTTNGTSILNGATGADTVNFWSSAEAIPFPFEFFGNPVTHFIVNKNGLVTFDTSLANTPVATNINVNTALPNPALPNQTIAMFWEDTANTSISSADHVYTYTYGTAPNRQFWIHYYSFEIGSQSFAYMAAVLEETTNKIYVVDMNYAQSQSTYTGTVGIQVDASTAFDVTTPLNGTSGSPDIQMGSGGSSESDNEYYEFEFFPAGACLPPTNLGATNITSTSADLFWSAGSGSTRQVEWDTADFGLGSGTRTNTVSDTLPLSSLSPLTAYEFYVRDSCGPGDFSTWSGPYAFFTLIQGPQGVNCITGSPAVLFTEEFDAQGGWTGDIGTSNGQWQINSGGTTSSNTGPSGAHSGSNYIYFEASSAGPAAMVSPMVDLTTANDEAELTFWMHAYGGHIGYLDIGVSNSPTGPFTNVFSYNQGQLQTSDSDPWQQVGVDLTAYIGQQIYLEFEADRTTSFEGDIALDLVEVNTCITCPSPSSLTQTNITADSATLGWVETGTATEWEVSYVAPGGSPGTGTQVTTMSNPLILTGISPNTTYDWFVRAICGAGDSSIWKGPMTFTTLCASQLSGTYTINSAQPTGGINFNSLSDAVSELNQCGVSGSVTFDVTPGSGPYNERIVLGAITGVDATNTVTFNGNGETLNHAPTVSAERAAILLDGSTYITINNFVINVDAGSYGAGVQLFNAASHNTISNNVINCPVNNTSSSFYGIAGSGSLTSSTTTGFSGDSNTISGNTVNNAYYGINLVGSTSPNQIAGNIIESNVVNDFYSRGVYLYGNDGTRVSNNDINRATRTSVTTMYGVYLSTDCQNLRVDANKIHDTHTGSSSSGSAYGIYSNGDADSGKPNIISNNLLYNFNSSSGTIYALYNSGSDGAHYYHNTVVVDEPTSTGGTTRGLYQTTTATDIDVVNNIFYITRGGSGTKHCLYFNSNSSDIISDHNVLFINAPSGSNYIGRWDGTNHATLVDWQTANSGAFDQNSVSGDPVFASASTGDLLPLAPLANDIGLPVGITEDINGDPRSLTTPDIGAYEFVPVNRDFALIDGGLFKGECLSTNDTVRLTVENIGTDTIDLSVTPLVAHWSVSGAASSSGIITVNTGTFFPQTSMVLLDVGVDLSVEGSYVLDAFILPSTSNLIALNDTLLTVSFTVHPIFSVFPKTDTLRGVNDSVEIRASSPFMPGGDFLITEICHFQTGTGEPIGGWPSYLAADDYIEITGVPGSDLAGYTLEQWRGTSMDGTHTFDPGTVMGPNGTAIIAVGSVTSSTPSPADFYYHGNGTFTGSYSSTTAAGRILKDTSGAIVDAVGYNGYTFPSAANVPASEWSNPLSGGGSSSGIRLEGPDVNTGTNWVLSSNSPQDPNTLNTNVPLPVPTTLSGFTWTLNGSVVDTLPFHLVNPDTAGVYHYVATYTNTPCGTLSDTVTIVADFPFDDIALIEFVPLEDDCGQDSMDIRVVVANLGALAQSNFTIDLDITGTFSGSFTYTYTGTLAGGQNDTVTLATVNTTAGGIFDVVAYTSLANDEVLGNDTIKVTGVEILPIPAPPTVPSQVTVCYLGDVTVAADTSQLDVRWYDAEEGGNPIHTGDTLILTNVTANDTVYAAASSGSLESVGAPDPSIGTYGTWSSTAQWMNFTVHQQTTIQSVEMYFSASVGTAFSIEIRDANTLTIVHTHNDTVAISNSTPTVPQEVPIVASLPPGDYQMNFGNSAGTFRNSTGGVYPYEIPGVLSITGNTFNPVYYYMFYNWKVGVPGCSSPRMPVSVNLHPVPTVDLGSDTGICANVPVNLTLDANNLPTSTVNWSTGATGSSINVTSTGTYWAEETTTEGCTLRDSIVIEVYTVPVVDIGEDTSFCEDEIYLLGLNAAWPNATYVWHDGSTGPANSASQPGLYWVEVTSQDGCIERDSVTITEHPLPTINLGDTIVINQGDTATLDAGNPGATFSWSTGASTQTIDVAASGSYSVTVTDAEGCQNADTVHVDVVTGIPTVAGVNHLHLFPNPTDGDAILEVDIASAGSLDVVVLEVTGKQVHRKMLEAHAGIQRYILPLSELPAGMYLVKLTWNDTPLTTLRIQRIR